MREYAKYLKISDQSIQCVPFYKVLPYSSFVYVRYDVTTLHFETDHGNHDDQAQGALHERVLEEQERRSPPSCAWPKGHLAPDATHLAGI